MLTVSHAASTLHELCERALWLDRGQLVMDGPVDDVLAQYQGAAAKTAH
jgi:ABC-type polysaccharide/polyol phosphate transport system ATPase subunit